MRATALVEGWADAHPSSSYPGDAPVVTLARARVVAEVVGVLGLPRPDVERIVRAFEDFVVQPMQGHLTRLKGRDLAKRNPMIYTVRGASSTEEWVDWVLRDKETSAVECLLGTWQEEVARIVSGGIKPGNGVDLQVDDGDIVDLYAIQSAPNTKNAGSSRHDVAALKSSAAVLRNQHRHARCYIAVLFGRNRTTELRREPGVVVLGSDDFWGRISGVADFRTRLLRATQTLSSLMHQRSSAEIERIRREALALYDDGAGRLAVNALANPPRAQARKTSPLPPASGIQLALPIRC